MKSRVIRTTRNASALAALGASLGMSLGVSPTAQAQPGHLYCVDETALRADAAGDPLASYSPYVNGCIRKLSDGRAAVLLPSALEPIQRIPTDQSLRRHAWGFLDENGRLAVRPIFENVRDFRHGLAAVQWQGKWGFINPKGRMAVAPRYDSVSDYAEIGLAVATLDGRRQLIDRRGEPVGAALDDAIDSLVLNDGVPALASVSYRAEYQSPSGERRYAKPGVEVIRPYGQGFFIAMNDERKYGLVDGDWNWVVQPAYDDISREQEGVLASAYGQEGAVLLGLDGALIGADQHYQDLTPVGKKFWSAALGRREGYAVLDTAGVPIVKLTDQEAQASQRFGDVIVYPSGGKLMALVPGQSKPLPLASGLAPSADVGGFILFRGEADVGLLTPKGVWLHGDTAPAWLNDAGEIDVRHGRLWIGKRDGGVLNIVDADGRTLLTPDTAEAVQNQTLKPLPLNVPGGPLAILGQSHCQCGPEGASLVLGDGSIVTDPSWTDLIPLDDQAEYGEREAPVAQDILKPEQLRYAAQTRDGMLLLDAQGRKMDLPVQQHIGPFRHGYALIYGGGVNKMIDRSGKIYALPDNVFDSDMVAPGVIRFVQTAADGAPWGLYDIVAGKQLAAPVFRDVGDFSHERAVASLGEGRVGVIDLQGKWIVAPQHLRVERVNDKLWKAMQAGGKDDDYDRPVAVFNQQGHALTPFVRRLYVNLAEDGSVTADSEQRRWIFSPDGEKAMDLQDATYTRLGDWLEIRRAPRHGYLNAQGAWQIEPSAYAGTVFQGTPARALASNETGARVIDPQGRTVATLPAGDWRWPVGSPTLLRYYERNGKLATDYTTLAGKTTLSVEGEASAFSEGRAVTRLSTRAMRAVDATGALTGPAFDALGALHGGLAPAVSGYSFGYVNGQGEYVIAAQYTAVTPFANQRAVVSTMDASSLIDPAGKALARVEMVCGVRTLYGSAGQRLWPNTMPARCAR